MSHLKKARRRRYSTEIITNEDYADDLMLPVNTPAQAEYLLLSLEQAAKDIGLNLNV